MVQAGRVGPEWPVLGSIVITCFHGHAEQCPVVQAQFHYHSQLHVLEVACMPHLPYPALLGRDAPEFAEMLQRATALAHGWAALVNAEPQAGPSDREEPGADVDDLAAHTDWETNPAFREAQDSDPTLEKVRSQVAKREEREVDPHWSQRWPQMVREAGLLFREMEERGQRWRQLLVPERYRETILQAAHDHPWASNQGPKPTLHRVLARFY